MSFRQGTSPHSAVTPNGVHVHLVVGCLTKIQANVLLNSTRHDLHLSGGGVSTKLALVAGDTVQTECREKAPNGIKTGEIVETAAGNLSGVSAIYHGAFDAWDGNDGTAEKALTKFITDSIDKASLSGYKTLAMPAIGTGILKYPHDRVAKLVLETIAESTSSTDTLTDVYISIYNKDDDSKKAFEEELQRMTVHSGPYWAGSNPDSILTPEGIIVRLSVGSIVNEEADVIINTTNHELNLSVAGVSAVLIGAAGDVVQDECDKEAPNGIETGDVVVTSAGDLKGVSKIYHGAFSLWDGDNGKSEKAVRSFLMKCLLRANGARYTSLVLPAIGTGILNYPHDRIARLVLDVVSEFSRNMRGNKLRLKDICISLYDKDNLAQTAFRSELKNVQTMGHQTGAPDIPRSAPVWHSSYMQIGCHDSFELPDHWQDMGGLDIKCVTVTEHMKEEYATVTNHFKETLKNKTIRKVKRVQNPYLYHTYLLRRQQMRSRDHCSGQEEQHLFHGTALDKLDEINVTNFNRSFSGDACAARYGDGVYFAKDALFSNRYTKIDVNGKRYMYRAKVLVGDYTMGTKGLRVPPKRPDGKKRFDSVVDNVHNPKEFVIFHDDAVYPEHIITYTD